MSLRKKFADAIRKPAGATALILSLAGTGLGATYGLHDLIEPEFTEQTTEKSVQLTQAFSSTHQELLNRNTDIQTLRDLKEAAVEKLDREMAMSLTNEIRQAQTDFYQREENLEASILTNTDLSEQDFITLQNSGAVDLPQVEETYRFKMDQNHFFKEAQTEVLSSYPEASPAEQADLIEKTMTEMTNSSNTKGHIIAFVGSSATLGVVLAFGLGGGVGGLASRIEKSGNSSGRRRRTNGLKRN